MRSATRYALIFFLHVIVLTVRAGTATISIDTMKPGPAINPRLYGIFLEEINRSVDGGLYAELVANRAFEDSRPPDGCKLVNGRWMSSQGWDSEFRVKPGEIPHWSLVKPGGARGSMGLETSGGANAQTPYCLRLDTEAGRVGVANDGFEGIGISAGAKYNLSLMARGTGTLAVRLEAADGSPVSNTVRLSGLQNDWKPFAATLTASRPEARARLVIVAEAKGRIWLDLVSLLPEKTWKNRGLRPDIAQMIADLKPGFVRFPGGCVIEGGNIASAYHWKQSVGPVAERPETWSAWNHRRTHGMGFYDYLQFCEDIGAAPLWVNNAGMSCIFRGKPEFVPMSEMGAVVDDFLDAVEFANGPATSKWGELRAQSGHPRPFDLNLIEISNESSGPEFPPRYQMVQKALHARYPDIRYIADLSWISAELMKDCHFDIQDSHIYTSCYWFVENRDVYASRDRKLPPLYLGEVAVTSPDGGDLKGNMRAALSEGVFMMGCERNGDVVNMISYAPLISHVSRPNGWHGMIYHDSTRCFGTVSYYLWKLFGTNVPGHTLATTVSVTPEKPASITGAIGVGTWNTAAEFKDIRVERDGRTLDLGSKWQEEGGRWTEANGVRTQSDPVAGMSYAGNESWSDYTLTLKARKLQGEEGFLVAFGRKGEEKIWWNIGGWGNREHALELNRNPLGKHEPGKIETGRWYDIRIELAGPRVRCFLDGKLIHDVTVPTPQRFFASAGRDATTGDLILKAINFSDEPVSATLAGAGKPGTPALRTVLRAGSLSDNNSLAEPVRIVPVSQDTILADKQEFPPCSLTVLRVKSGPPSRAGNSSR